jgi:glycosyltransferase involved in cell wall biosynthesis
LKFEFDSPNPGIGGTEYVTLRLLSLLAKKYSKSFDFCLCSTQQSIFADSKLIRVINPLELEDADMVIAPVSQINFLERNILNRTKCYVWSHHPHDRAVWHLSLKKVFLAGLISIGRYQYWSNKYLFGPHYFLRNPFPPQPRHLPMRSKRKLPKEFVFIGGLYVGKGFHLWLKLWPKIRAARPGARLTVIGGALYDTGGDKSEGSKAKSQMSDAQRYRVWLKKIIAEMNPADAESVKFIGIATPATIEQVMGQADLAILNPTGKTEAAPASPLDCIKFGIPVAAGGDYGMHDIMCNFPEYDCCKKSMDSVVSSFADEELFAKNTSVAHSMRQDFEDLNEEILRDWIVFFEQRVTFLPRRPPFLILFKLFFRSIIITRLKWIVDRIVKLSKQ